MGANFSGERRKRAMKRSLKNCRTRTKQPTTHTVVTLRGAILRPAHEKPATKTR
jgi:hypothetical protein